MFRRGRKVYSKDRRGRELCSGSPPREKCGDEVRCCSPPQHPLQDPRAPRAHDPQAPQGDVRVQHGCQDATGVCHSVLVGRGEGREESALEGGVRAGEEPKETPCPWGGEG